MFVAQSDRALVSEAKGRGFDSPRAQVIIEYNGEQMSVSSKCLINIGCHLIILWCLVFISFLGSYAFSFILENWIQVGWIVPMFACIGLILIFVIASAFLFLIYIKESIYKQTEITLGLFNKADYILSKKWLTNLSIVTFWFTMLLALLAVWTWILFVLASIACFAYDFIKNKFNKKTARK